MNSNEKHKNIIQAVLAQRIRRQQREVANKLPQQKQLLPLHFVSCSLSLMRACVCFAVHGIASTRCRATKGQSLFAALVYCGSVF
jgi:hypothetical protein